ncbi:MAG: Fe-S protein assembly co-chaperone HscB [Bryobacterales bacterium]|nr:Fe-S protein assembly co-chaperone HscB [Bryobacterales bacterium]
MDYFSFFGLERKLTLDASRLQQRFYQLSKEYHPDRFAQKPAEERLKAEEASAILNDGYRVLRDPVQRAEYVLRQEGFDIGEQRSKDVPPELLEEVFELNMALEELRHGDEDARASLKEAHGKFVAMRAAADEELCALGRRYDETPGRDALQQIRALLNRRRYIRNLVAEVEKELA